MKGGEGGEAEKRRRVAEGAGGSAKLDGAALGEDDPAAAVADEERADDHEAEVEGGPPRTKAEASIDVLELGGESLFDWRGEKPEMVWYGVWWCWRVE